ncbi:hypothetical protein CFIO01_09552 [Colletotrichum fioriniae PJ7]|uniref:Uncharacterized protein n=1 Tax=Colletotrichum fioriniae PJ7 TaxID=1445577 RepID=A0A010RMQ3_9PEZI|nr:hypothetical protein CFIO01_09552 [Colletotrichum fioriniae PJ7]
MHCCIDTSPADRDFRLAARARAGNNEWSTWTSERGKTIRLRESAVVWLCWVLGLGLGLGWFDGIDTSNVMAASSPLFVPLSRGPFASRSPTSSTFPRYHAPPFQSISLEPVRYRTGIGKVRDGSEAGRQRCAKVDSESSESYLWLGISKLVSMSMSGNVSVVYSTQYSEWGQLPGVPSLAAWFVCPPPERELPSPASVGSTAHGTMKRRVQPDPGKSSTPKAADSTSTVQLD